MVARTRKSKESFKAYRAALKREAEYEKARLSGRMSYVSISFIWDRLKELFIAKERGRTFIDGRNQRKRLMPSKAERKRARRERHQ